MKMIVTINALRLDAIDFKDIVFCLNSGYFLISFFDRSNTEDDLIEDRNVCSMIIVRDFINMTTRSARMLISLCLISNIYIYKIINHPYE